MAFLHAYFDDSASEEGGRRLYMAGYLNRAEKWALFSEAWDEELRMAPAVAYLKMSEANHLTGQFNWRHGWTEEKRDEKLRGFARVIRHFKPLSFEFSISRQEFYDRVKPVSPRGLGNPHFIACVGAVSMVARYVNSEKVDLPIDFIFDQQKGVDSDVTLFFDQLIGALPRGAKKLINGAPIFRDEQDRQFLPLQAADMLAWHLRREHEMGTPNSMAELLRADDGHVVSAVDNSLIKLWEDHHSKLPEIRNLQSKAQWRALKKEIARLRSLGIDPSTIGRRKSIFERAREGLSRLFGA